MAADSAAWTLLADRCVLSDACSLFAAGEVKDVQQDISRRGWV